MDNKPPRTTPDPVAIAPAAKPWQFSLQHLLAVMAAACVAGAAYQWIGAGVLLLVGLILVVIMLALAISRGKWIETLVVVGVILVPICICVLPTIDGGSRTPARRSACQNNLKQIMIALQNYHDVYHRFPPAYVADANGKPMHSWRVLILPFLEQKPLYDLYRFDEPWDGPNNRKLAGDLKILMCPADGTGKGQTSYVAVVGPGIAWPGAKSIDLADIKDGASNTILVVEVHNSGISWMEPRDLDVSQMPMTINPKSGLGISSGHPRCAQAARADGSVFAIDENTPPETIRAMLTIAGGESIPEP